MFKVDASVKLEEITDTETLRKFGLSPSITKKDRWQDSINLYHLLQRYCTHPAHFWFNYQWSIPVGSDRVSMNTPEALKEGWFLEILRELAQGTVNPQEWCNTN